MLQHSRAVGFRQLRQSVRCRGIFDRCCKLLGIEPDLRPLRVAVCRHALVSRSALPKAVSIIAAPHEPANLTLQMHQAAALELRLGSAHEWQQVLHTCESGSSYTIDMSDLIRS